MAAEPLVPVFFKLPASMVNDGLAVFSATSGIPDPSRSMMMRAALGAYIVAGRQSGAIRSPEPPVPRQRSRAIAAPPQPIARRVAG